MAIAVMRLGRVDIRSRPQQTGVELKLGLIGCRRRDNRLPFAMRGRTVAIDDDNLPKKKVVHEIGQELALLSIEELAERIGALREEIARLEGVIAAKKASRTTADQFFKR